MLRKRIFLLVALIICSLIMAPAGLVRAYNIRAATNNYEPDNSFTQAKLITSGASQTRSIVPETDVDWIKFQLSVPSAIVLETNGPFPSDTRIRLYQSNGTNTPTPMEVNDDDGVGYYSYIDRVCGVDPLPAGTYLLRVEEYLRDREIPSYDLYFQSSPCPAQVVDTYIGAERRGTNLLAINGSTRRSFTGVNSGPVKIVNTSGPTLIAAERMIYKSASGVPTSYSEMMGLADSQIDTVYWLPWYNNKDASINTQLRIANISATDATVSIFIGGQPMPGNPITLKPGVSIRKSYLSIDKGPVKIESDVNIIASERVIFKVNGKDVSYSEMMALPGQQLANTYWLPWYNSKDLDTQIRVANVSDMEATVNVSIAGAPVTGSPFVVPPGGSIRKNFPGIDKGPVKIESDVDIVASERVIYKINGVATSFSELMAVPNNLVTNTYWLPWYNNVDLDTQLRVANVSGASATIRVYVAGNQVTGSPFNLLPGASARKSFTGVNKGPVKVESDQEIVVAERVIYKVNKVPTSFSEMMGLPASQLDPIYWIPWYNNVDLDTQLRFGVPQ